MSKLDITIYDLFGEKGDSGYVLVDAKKINKYINLAKALETEHEALKKDVDRYFHLRKILNVIGHEELNEFIDVLTRLSKVGKEE